MSERNDGLTPVLREATRLLRDTPTVRRDWRNALEQEIATAPRPARVAARQFTFTPVAAIAAGLACAMIGGAAVALVTRGSPPPQAAVSTSATATTLVRFTLVAPNASNVSIVGDFNRWDPTALPLRRSADGQSWEVEVPLQPGRYTYSFVVDGTLARDPSAPQAADDFGKANSVVLVRGS